MRTFSGFDRGDRGIGVRDILLVAPSVGCTNRTVELLGRARPDARIVTHQHGCGLLGGDLDLTADVLAGSFANPNVRAGVVIGLGCESNIPDEFAERARSRGVPIELTVFQRAGGAEKSVAQASTHLDAMSDIATTKRECSMDELTVGILCDAASGDVGRRTVDDLAAALEREGVHVRTATDFATDDESATAVNVTDTWNRRGRLRAPAALDDVRVTSEIEQLSVFAASGAQITVFVTGRGNPMGSPIAPTIKIASDPRFAALADAVAGDIAALVDLVVDVAGGRTVKAERQRDFGVPRIGPTM